MLDILRSKSRSVLTYVLFGIIIVVFVVSFGPGSQGCQVEGLSASSAVEVDGYVVAPADYEEAYGNLFRTSPTSLGCETWP
jgi:peptidyl-prolyl cis-trans isomerase D